MHKLFTNMRFTSEDISSLGLQIAKVEFRYETAQSENKEIKKWCRANCSATWGYSTTIRSYHSPSYGNGYVQNYSHYIHSYFYIFTDEADLLSLSLAFDGAQIRCLWPSNMTFNVFLVEDE